MIKPGWWCLCAFLLPVTRDPTTDTIKKIMAYIDVSAAIGPSFCIPLQSYYGNEMLNVSDKFSSHYHNVIACCFCVKSILGNIYWILDNNKIKDVKTRNHFWWATLQPLRISFQTWLILTTINSIHILINKNMGLVGAIEQIVTCFRMFKIISLIILHIRMFNCPEYYIFQ